MVGSRDREEKRKKCITGTFLQKVCLKNRYIYMFYSFFFSEEPDEKEEHEEEEEEEEEKEEVCDYYACLICVPVY